uniref:Erythrocyte membrane antigen 1 n=1 Tax=Parastrongyloides trichosuri TaxID=131310 RepID=A0A0N5A3U8_PARTI
MFNNLIILLFLISFTYEEPDKLHLEFSKDDESNHRHSIDTLEPELAHTIFSTLPINPQERTTIKPFIKRTKKVLKPSIGINYLVRVKKDVNLDYVNINSDFLHSSEIMFSHDEAKIDDDNKSITSTKHGDVETVTMMLPSLDIQIDKEDKKTYDENWRKLTAGYNSENKEQLKMEENKKTINDEDMIDKKDLDDFFDEFNSFSENLINNNETTREKRDAKNIDKRALNINGSNRKIRMGYIKVKSGNNKLQNSTEVQDSEENYRDETIKQDIELINNNENNNNESSIINNNNNKNDTKEEIRIFWNIYFNNGTTRKEMFTQREQITTPSLTTIKFTSDNSNEVIDNNLNETITNKVTESFPEPLKSLDNSIDGEKNNIPKILN